MRWQDQMVESGDVTQDQLADAIRLSEERGISVQDALLIFEYTTAWPITRAHAVQYGYPVFNFYEADIPVEIICAIPEVVFRDFRACPVMIQDDVLWYATPFFDDVSRQHDISVILNRRMAPMWAPDSWLRQADRKFYTDSYYTRFMTGWIYSRHAVNDWLLVDGNRYKEYCAARHPRCIE